MKNSGIFPAMARVLLSAVLVLAAVPAASALSSATLTTLNVSSNSVSTGSAVTLTASVSSGGTPVAAGLVVFCNTSVAYCEDSAIFGSAWMTKSGTATIHKTFGPGTYNIQAVFKGTNSYATSTSPTQTVTVTGSPLPTKTTINSSGTPSSIVLTATVTTSSAVAPTGSVSFLESSNGNYQDASAGLGAAVLTSGFGSTSGPAATSSNQAIAIGDFNNDGKPDYVIANLGNPATVTIMLGHGDGTFTAAATYSAGVSPEAAAVADFNGDGNLDVAFANSSGTGVTVLLGNGDGTFTAATSPALAYASSITVGDFNGDGIPDLAVANNNTNYQVTVLLGNGDGTFTAGSSTVVPQWSVNPEGILAADFNGDGKSDLAVTSSDSYSPASYVVTILLGSGDGTFTTGQSYTTGASGMSIAAGDFKGNGIPDLAIANYADNTVTILLGNGDGTFSSGTMVATGKGPFSIVAGDFNNDGNVDLVTANYKANTVTILQGNGDGTFTAASQLPGTGANPSGIVAGDFNGDGLLDLVTANHTATTASILLQAVTSTATAVASGVSVGGTQDVLASYGGDANYQGSSSSAIPVTGIPVATPILSLATGTYPVGQTLTISEGTADASIYYTTNGNPPTASSTPYGGTITLNSSEIISAIAVAGSSSSPVVTASYTISGSKESQTITFLSPGIQVYAPGPAPSGTIQVSATASSGLTVSFKGSFPGNANICSLVDNLNGSATVTLLGAGTCTIEAMQAGNGTYAAATSISVQFTVSHASQSITFSSLTAEPIGTAQALTATASSGLPVTFTSQTSTICTITGAGTTVTGNAGGTCTVQATAAGTAQYAAATPVSRSFTVSEESQTITFLSPGTQVYAPGPAPSGTIQVSATASSGLTVSFKGSFPGNANVCSLVDNLNGSATVTLLGAGTCTIEAMQAGNGTYAAATSISVQFTVSHASQSITFSSLTAEPIGTAQALTATASSGLPVTFTSQTSTICTITGAGTTVTGNAGGTCTVQATAAGTAQYAAATPVTQSFTVSKESQTITFLSPGTQVYAPGPAPSGTIQVSATASSGLTVSFKGSFPGNANVCSLVDNLNGSATVTLLGAGTCTIEAMQAGNGTYAAATSISVQFTVSHASQSITFSSLTAEPIGTAQALTATASSGLPVTFTSLTSTICTITGAGTTVTGNAVGTCKVQASAAGTAQYAAATPVTQSFTVVE